MATYEGKWRCLRCSTINLGRFLNCQSCGVKRDDDVEFFLDDNPPETTDAERLREANAGADWICSYCGGNNRAFDERCTSCGNLRSTSDKQLVEETRGVNDWTEAAQNAADSAHQNAASPAATNVQNQLPKSSFLSSRFFKLGLLGLGVLAPVLIVLFGILVYVSTLTYPVEVEVTGLEWQRSISIEEYRAVTETAWEGEVPSAARIQSKENAIHHTNQVPTGTRSIPETYSEKVSDGTERYVCGRKNKKNGYFEDVYCTRAKYKTVTKTRNRTETIYRSVPVYRTRYTYLINKWMTAGEKTTSGTDFNPVWATVAVDNIRTRERGRTENYLLICKELAGKNKSLKLKLAADGWSKFQNGMRLHGKTNFYGNLISIDELPNGAW